MSDYYTAETLEQPQCIRCNCFMAWDGRACKRCGWPEIYDENGVEVLRWPRRAALEPEVKP